MGCLQITCLFLWLLVIGARTQDCNTLYKHLLGERFVDSKITNKNYWIAPPGDILDIMGITIKIDLFFSGSSPNIVVPLENNFYLLNQFNQIVVDAEA